MVEYYKYTYRGLKNISRIKQSKLLEILKNVTNKLDKEQPVMQLDFGRVFITSPHKESVWDWGQYASVD